MLNYMPPNLETTLVVVSPRVVPVPRNFSYYLLDEILNIFDGYMVQTKCSIRTLSDILEQTFLLFLSFLILDTQSS